MIWSVGDDLSRYLHLIGFGQAYQSLSHSSQYSFHRQSGIQTTICNPTDKRREFPLKWVVSSGELISVGVIVSVAISTDNVACTAHPTVAPGIEAA
ncbi:hypothetical protein M404DRAFT_991199, partial [Pisolithus tinctorius Marx 270]